ncbi:MAG: 2Fe-2S iron-sulfur cluster binding domain-containing protein [Proteobacteria bacterium]|nr:2Fe-2S iron-sulfur cluster binding domain-containing protein [Pseudomonadota bacterium]
MDSIPAVTTTIGTNTKEIVYSGKDTVLESLEQNAFPPRFACRVGVCGTGKCRLKSGEVNQFPGAGLSRTDIKNKYILICVSRPQNEEPLDLEIRLSEKATA